MQQRVEAPPGDFILLPQRRAGLPGEAAGGVGFAGGGERLEACQQDPVEAVRRRPRRPVDGVEGAHHGPPSVMPSSMRISGVIISGVHGGS